jgi:hypothetical protein
MKQARLFLSIVLMVTQLSLPCAAVAEPIPEYQMKAAYLYNFAAFTTWPTPPNNAVRLCVLGNDSFGGALDKLTKNPSGGVRIVLSYLSDVNDVNHCQILFIDASELHNSANIMKHLDRFPVLTVTDNPDMFQAGAMIGLFLDNKRLTFDVNYVQAKNAQLSISSKLLRVARRVLQ